MDIDIIDRTQAPAFTRDTVFQLLKPDVTILPNGVHAYFITGGDQPVVKIEVIIHAGRWYETHWGAAYFAGQLLSKGTTEKSGFQIAEIFDQYGAHLEISPGLDVISISLYTLVKHVSPTLNLLLELLNEATYPEKEIEQLKTIYIQNHKINSEKTSFQASNLIRRNLYGESFPYGKDLEINDVVNLSQEAISNYYRTYFHDFFIIASGKINEQTKEIVSAVFSKASVKRNTTNAPAHINTQPFKQVVEREGSLQSSIRIAKRFINRKHKDYAAVLFLNHILGGYFGSRLMKNIREDKGYTYGISSSIHSLIQDSFLMIGADVNQENREPTFIEIKKELRQLCDEPIDLNELETARNHFIGSLQSEINTPFAHADKVKNMLLYNLPANYYQDLILRVDNLKSEELMPIAAQYFNPESFFEVAVG